MSDRRRERDGRFKPKTGDSVLPPRKKQPRDENGNFISSEKVPTSKPYSKALRELLETREGGMPDHWVREDLTEAQALAMIHLSIAKSGNDKMGLQVIDRAEGKVPQAVEDREAQLKAGTGLKLLAELLGIKDAEVETIPQLTEGEWSSSESSETASSESESESPSVDASTSSSESSLDE